MNQQLDALDRILNSVSGPEFDLMVEEISKPDASSDVYVRLPTGADADLTRLEVSRLIANASNKYGKAIRLAAIARALAKAAEAKYKYKFRTSLGVGKNKEEREAYALAAAEEEYNTMMYFQAVQELCESVESAARIASESARKMMEGAEQSRRADNREQEHNGSLFTQW